MGLGADPYGGLMRASTAAVGTTTLQTYVATNTTTGTATAGTVSFGANALDNRPRVLYACTSGADGGLVGGPQDLNRQAGFRTRQVFGMSTWNSSARLFVGLNSGTGLVPALSSDPAARLATGFGVCVPAAGSVFSWVWASGAIGTGSSTASGITFSADHMYSLILASDANGSTVVGTLLDVGTGDTEDYTFSTLPTDTELHRPVFVARGVASTTYLNFCRWDSWQDIDAQWGA